MLRFIISTLPMFVCAFFSTQLAVLLFERRNMTARFLLPFMVTATLLYMAHGIFFNHNETWIPVTDTIYSFCNPAVYPLYYIYIRILTERKPYSPPHYVLLIPSLLCYLAVGILYVLMDREETTAFIRQYLYENQYDTLTGLAYWQAVVHGMVKVVFAIQIIPIVYRGYRSIRDYNQIIVSNYADTEGKTLHQMQALLIFFVITSFASFLINLIGRYHFADSLWLLVIPSLTFSVLLFMIGYVGTLQEFTINDIDITAEEEEEKHQLSDFPIPPDASDLLIQLQKLVKEERLFLKHNLKINDLARRLNTNRNYIYNTINQGIGMSFSEYINRQRIDYALDLIREKPDMPLSDAAYKSGFASATSFYRNFRQYVGYSPKDFQNRIKRAASSTRRPPIR